MGSSNEKQRKSKGKKLNIGRFLPLPHSIIKSKEFRGLSFSAVSLLIDIAVQHNGNNNGKLVCTMKYLRPLGWSSNDTVTRAKRQLEKSGLIIQTRQGMKPPCSQAAWFAIGWLALEVENGLDISSRAYRKCITTPIDGLSPIKGMKKAVSTPTKRSTEQTCTPENGVIAHTKGMPRTPINGEYIELPYGKPVIESTTGNNNKNYSKIPIRKRPITKKTPKPTI